MSLINTAILRDQTIITTPKVNKKTIISNKYLGIFNYIK